MSLALTSGHTLVITHEKAGSTVPTHFRREAIAKGCIPVGISVDDEKKSKKATAAEKRAEQIRVAIEKLLDSDDEAAFDEDAKPNVKKLSEAVGFEVTTVERDEVWATLEAGLKK
ncbi:hypothetical protein [Solimonas marina]|uniref:Uncharacterized protein n=1 Tax=Solimonas marina TaxID=2714601 RepID=A0A970B5D0_9GAMM|nr:hypothetical protein [Solimonas marina]NKF21578.1 hypothetical protein [Solimonas marina]